MPNPTDRFRPFEEEEVEQSVPARFEQQVRRFPDQLAIKSQRQELTYRELNAAANRVAHAILAQRGEGEEPVALFLEHGAPVLVAILGTLKAGKIYVPLDPSYPRARLAAMLDDCQARLILVDNGTLPLADPLRQQGRSLIHIDEIDPRVSTEDPGLSLSPDTLAYILYTSGSTGQPKGVVHNHRSLLHHVGTHTNMIQIGPHDRLSLLHSCSFSAARLDYFGALLNGAAVYPYPAAGSGIRHLAAWLTQEEITVLSLLPTGFRHFASTLTEGQKFPRLRTIALGSEPVHRRDVEIYKLHFSADCVFINRLGTTETGTLCYHVIHRETPIADSIVPVGYSIPGVDILLLDPDGKEVKPQQVGEIAVRSSFLAVGYWRKPELTEAAFQPDPDGSGRRIYRTGDVGRVLPDGCLVHLGRKDFQVKVRGYRVEVAEIEAALLELCAFAEVVVVAREDPANDRRLIAYLVPARQPPLTVSEIRRALAERLPDYMIPAAFVMLDALPLTPTGKVDRQALPPPDGARPNLGVAYVAPRTPVEEAVATLWASALGLEQVGIHDSFFELGGDSLSATRLLFRIRDMFEVEVPPRCLFEAPTVAGLVEKLCQQEGAPGRPMGIARCRETIEGLSADEIPRDIPEEGTASVNQQRSMDGNGRNQDADPLGENEKRPARLMEEELRLSPGDEIVPRARKGELPLSFAQQRLWFIDELLPGNPLYQVPKAVRLRGELKTEILQQALDTIVARHEALRTTIAVVEGRPRQVIAESRPVELKRIDLREGVGYRVSGVGEEPSDPTPNTRHPTPCFDREAAVQRLLTEEVLRPFDLARDLMLRVVLVRLAEEEHVLLLVMHHINSDGWSRGVLIRELSALYAAFAAGRPSPLPELPIQYADYALWQREWLQGERLAAQLTYWKQQLEGAPPILELPTDRPWPAVQSFRGERHSFRLSSKLTQALKALSQRERVTLFMTLLAGFQTLLHRYTGQEDIVVGAPIANRTHAETEAMIGFFANMLVMRADLSGDPSFQELLGRVREAAFSAYAHQDLPFEKLVDELQTERDLSHTPVFQVAFAFQNLPAAPLDLPGLTSEPVEIDNGTAIFALSLFIAEDDEGLRGVFEYSTDLFDDATITRMQKHFQVLLEGIAAHPEERLSWLPLLTEAEQHQLLVEWSQTGTESPVQGCVHERFEAQVEATPDAVAVSCDGDELTYRELNRRANQLAHYLRERGVGPDVPVGLCVERSVEMVVGLLGILKAGGAYLPLDPTHPKDRLEFMLGDARPKVLVTQQQLLPSLPEEGPERIYLGTDWETIACSPQDNLVSGVREENLVYVIYTSGSTGRPKGVAVEHRNLVNYLEGILERLHLSPGASFAMVSSLATDLGNTVLFPSLCTGGCLHVISQERASDGAALADYFARHRIDCLKIVPSHLAALQSGSQPERLLPRQRLVLGGEASRSEWVRQLQALAPDCTILNHYGPTETTVGVLTYQLDADRVAAGTPTLPLGRPLANTHVYVLDPHQQPVPIGVPGELYIGGRSLARGYLHRRGLTAEKFVPDPFSSERGARLYRTGDRVRFLADGNLEFLGRMDDQLKVRGYRIELGEIEAALTEHPDLSEAAVVPWEDPSGHRRLVAYGVPRPERAPTVAGKKRYPLPNNMAVVHLNKNETDYLYAEIFERQAYLKHGITLKPGDCIVDVGANIGMFALFASQICDGPTVYAFEPNPSAFEALSANTSLSHLDVRLFNCGLSRETGTAEFTFFEGFSLFSGFYADAETEKEVVKTYLQNQQKQGAADLLPLIEQADEILEDRFVAQTFTAPLRTLSGIIEEEQIERIDLLKINVEKSEWDVLAGIREADWQKIQQIVLEVDVPEHREPMVALLKQHGYEVAVEQDRLLEGTPLCYLYAIRPSEERRLIPEPEEGTSPHPVPLLASSLLTADELRQFLSQRLPEYMVPSHFVLLERLPRMANGKVDRNELPPPQPAGQERDAITAARTPVEATLVQIWAEVLGQQQVGVHDNFFELGGDSILSIQVIAQAHQQGLQITPRQFFQNQTIAKLAAVAGTAPAPRAQERVPAGGRLNDAEEGRGTGPVPLTPIQRWFFEQDLPDPHHWNMPLLLELRQPLDPGLLERAVEVLLRQHQALRLRFRREETGWQQTIAAPDEIAPFARVDLSRLTAAEQEPAIEAAAAEYQASLDLTAGLLMRAVLFDCAPHQPDRLLFIVHHLAVDGISWRILLEEMQSVYQLLRHGQPIQLPPEPTSFRYWAERLMEYARSAELRQELDYWVNRPWSSVVSLPVDHPREANSVASARSLSVSLSAEETRALLQEVPEAYRTQINDVLLTALAQAIAPWTGSRSLLVDLEGHGREEIFEEVDLSRTVGWFTTLFPVLLDLPEAADPGEALKSVKEQLRGVPHRGIGYGLLRYGSGDTAIAAKLRTLPQAEISFNYMGQFDPLRSATPLFELAGDGCGPVRSQQGCRSHLLAVNGIVKGGRLQLDWSYSEEQHCRATIEGLAQAFIDALRSLITHCQSAKAGGYTPSDFRKAKLNQKDLDRLLSRINQVGG
jgi:amino acid adenylation domain-containing protein/non-ribosomal peptide synthase protein (TIGR01720 family)/FkbM family methyltransferase